MSNPPLKLQPNPWVRRLDAIAEFTGTSTAWLTLAMVLITSWVVLMRHAFGIGSIALQESVIYMHAAVFMLGSAYTLKRGGHVRVDIFHRRYSREGNAWIEILGGLLFTIPLMVFIGVSSWDFVAESWRIREASTDSGGLAWVYWLKALLPLMAVSVGLQACADVLRHLLVLMNIAEADHLSHEGEGAC